MIVCEWISNGEIQIMWGGCLGKITGVFWSFMMKCLCPNSVGNFSGTMGPISFGR